MTLMGCKREISKRFSGQKFYQKSSMVPQRGGGIAVSTPATESIPFWRKVKNSGFMTAMRTSLRPCAKLLMKNYLTNSGGIVVMFCIASFRKVEQSVITCGPADMTTSFLLKIIEIFSIEFCLKILFDQRPFWFVSHCIYHWHSYLWFHFVYFCGMSEYFFH